MLKAFDAACFGYVSFDTRYLVDKYPSENLWTEIRTQQADLGGDAAIIASNLASLGFHVGLVGTGIGSDERGKKIRTWLTEKKIETSIDNLYESTTYNLVLLSLSGGSRTWFSHGEERSKHRDPNTYNMWLLTQARIVYVDGRLQEGTLKAIQVAKEAKKPVLLQSGPWVADTILPNVFITVHSLSDYHQVSPDYLIRRDLNQGVKLAIVTEGKNGCLFGTPNGIWRLSGHDINTLDTAGAGATFMSGIMYGYLKDLPLEATPAIANALAALKVSVLGNLVEIDINSVMALSKKSILASY